jgi:hypothetical protein
VRMARTFKVSETSTRSIVDPGLPRRRRRDLGLKVEESDQFIFAFSPTLEVGGRVATGNATQRPYA